MTRRHWQPGEWAAFDAIADDCHRLCHWIGSYPLAGYQTMPAGTWMLAAVTAGCPHHGRP
jgi:hypothetical protein